MPSHPRRLIPEYVNLRILGLRRIKIIWEKDKNRDGKSIVFDLINLFVYMAMYTTNYIILEKEIFPDKFLHH